MRRVLAAAALAAAVLAGGSAAARPFTVDDLLHQESLGAVAVGPRGRWLVFERRDPYDTADRYDQHFATPLTLGRLRVADLAAGGPARPLVAGDPRGLVLGPFSPEGTRLVVFDARAHGWRLGVVTVATGAVRWFPLTPQAKRRGRALQWISERELLVLARPDGWPPVDLRHDGQATARLTAAWAAAASGAGAHTVLGSGRYAGVRARPPARRLLRIDVATGTVRELARGPFIDLELSPDRTRVAVFRAGADLQPRPDGPVRGPAGQETEVTALSVLDAASGRTVAACESCGDLLPNLLAWAPDGRRLLVWARGADGLWTSGGLARVDAGSGAVARLPGDLEAHATLNPVSVRAGFLAGRPLLYGRVRGTARWGWLRFDGARWIDLTRALPRGAFEVLAVGDGRLVVLAGGDIVALDAEGRVAWRRPGPAALAQRRFRGTPGARIVNALPAATWVRIGTGAAARLWRITASGPAGRAPAPPGGATLAGLSGPAGATVIRGSTARGVERLAVATGGGGVRVLATLNPGLAATDAPEVVAVPHRGPAGEPLTSWMVLPRRAPGAPPPPVIVRPYIGYSYAAPPRDLYLEQGFFQNLRMLTGHGYAVLVPSLPAPPGGLRDPAAGIGDRLEAILAAAAAEPALKGRFDPDRAALLGWSFGGYTTMAAITQTDRFRAAVALDGISDLVAYWSALPPARAIVPEDGYSGIGVAGTVEQTQPRLGAPPWADPDRYRRNSPLLAADRIHTPLLLLHGALDPVPLAGSEAMFQALFRQGKDAMLVIYWGANHAATAPGDVRDVWARTFAFLDAHLAPAPGPAADAGADGPAPP